MANISDPRGGAATPPPPEFTTPETAPRELFSAADAAAIAEMTRATQGYHAVLLGVADALNTSFASNAVAEGMAEFQRRMEESAKAAKELAEETEKVKKSAPQLKNLFGLISGEALGKEGGKYRSFIDSVGDSVESASKKFLSPATFVGGFIGLMMYGEAKHAQLAAEAAKLKDIFEPLGGATEKQMKVLAGAMENLQMHFIASREEFKKMAQEFVTEGLSANMLLATTRSSLLGTNEQVYELSLRFDKWLNLAAGTSAKELAGIMRDYGVSIEQASQKYEGLLAAATKSGGGVYNFLTAVQQSSAQLKMYGADLTEVSQMLLALEQGYRKTLGVTPEDKGGGMAAAALAREGLSGALQGLQGLGVGWQVALGERISTTGATGLGARYEMVDVINRMERGGMVRDNNLFDMIRGMREYAREAAPGDPTTQRYFLEATGFGIEGSRAIMTIGDKLKENQKLSSDDLKTLRNAFQTEQEKTNGLLRTIELLQRGLIDIGLGLLQAIVSGLGTILVGIIHLGNIITFSDDQKKSGKSLEKLIELSGQGTDRIVTGIETSLSALPEFTQTLSIGPALSEIANTVAELFTDLDEKAPETPKLENIEFHPPGLRLLPTGRWERSETPYFEYPGTGLREYGGRTMIVRATSRGEVLISSGDFLELPLEARSQAAFGYRNR